MEQQEKLLKLYTRVRRMETFVCIIEKDKKCDRKTFFYIKKQIVICATFMRASGA